MPSLSKVKNVVEQATLFDFYVNSAIPSLNIPILFNYEYFESKLVSSEGIRKFFLRKISLCRNLRARYEGSRKQLSRGTTDDGGKTATVPLVSASQRDGYGLSIDNYLLEDIERPVPLWRY